MTPDLGCCLFQITDSTNNICVRHILGWIIILINHQDASMSGILIVQMFEISAIQCYDRASGCLRMDEMCGVICAYQ